LPNRVSVLFYFVLYATFPYRRTGQRGRWRGEGEGKGGRGRGGEGEGEGKGVGEGEGDAFSSVKTLHASDSLLYDKDFRGVLTFFHIVITPTFSGFFPQNSLIPQMCQC
jgi:hypothetical protein